MRTAALTLSLLFSAAMTASAQVDVGTGIGPDAFSGGSPKEKRPSAPLGLAISMSVDPSSWTSVGLSSAAVSEIETMLQHGYYKLELIQLTLMALRTGDKLSTMTTRREKEGIKLRKIAEDLKLDYDALYESSLKLSEEVDERLVSLMHVGPLPKSKPSGGSP